MNWRDWFWLAAIVPMMQVVAVAVILIGWGIVSAVKFLIGLI